MRHLEDRVRRRFIQAVGIARDGVAHDPDVAARISEVDEHSAVGGVQRIEGDAQETPLAPGGDAAADIEKRARPDGIVMQHQHAAGLLDDEQALRVPGRGREIHRTEEVADELQRR